MWGPCIQRAELSYRQLDGEWKKEGIYPEFRFQDNESISKEGSGRIWGGTGGQDRPQRLGMLAESKAPSL